MELEDAMRAAGARLVAAAGIEDNGQRHHVADAVPADVVRRMVADFIPPEDIEPFLNVHWALAGDLHEIGHRRSCGQHQASLFLSLAEAFVCGRLYRLEGEE